MTLLDIKTLEISKLEAYLENKIRVRQSCKRLYPYLFFYSKHISGLFWEGFAFTVLHAPLPGVRIRHLPLLSMIYQIL